ncbi:hypothetical protein ADINL_1703 [Nitrincola lacisaponensis]|uniref:Uncharacterized protein n=1 Tax=Nitrincola lacisaponensis TaxID=267850 RepID=A0A063Y3R7_9GAMM|nr:hypothetical protein ADINL_1703 [Nitrincola lacisaponensis]
MGRYGGVSAFLVGTVVAGDPVAPVKTLNGVVGDPSLHLLLDQGVGY